MRKHWVRLAIVLALTGCGDDGADDDAARDDEATQSCYDVCREQAAAEKAGNCEGITEAQCRALCDAALSDEACSAEFTELNECRLTGEFSCGLVSAESDADCDAQTDDYLMCSEANAPACEGADENGRCPAVPCACPDGETLISGFDNSGGACRCLTPDTCLDLC